MTDSKLKMSDKTQIARAIIASIISDNEDMEYANPKLIEKNKVKSDKLYLTLLKSHFVGYPLGDELVPLAQILSGESLNRTEEQKEIGLTKQDLLLDDANAMLHDHLLNISPPFALQTDDVLDMPVINHIYEKVLKESVFAGKIDNSESEKFKEAMNFLFDEDENGTPIPNETYRTHEEFEARTLDLLLEIHNAKKDNETQIVNLLEKRLDRLDVEWHTIGQKTKVEESLKIISDTDKSAGFEDDRIRLLNLFNDKTQGRLTSDLRYGIVQLSPLAMLFDTEDNTLWHKFELSASEVRKAIGVRERFDFDIEVDDIEKFTERLSSFNFEYTSCMIRREWLDRDFLNSRYWKHDTVISDGKGKGALPTLPRRVFFIRDVHYSLKGQYEVTDSNMFKAMALNPAISAPKRVQLHKEKEPKLLKEIHKIKVLGTNFKKSHGIKAIKKMTATSPKVAVASATAMPVSFFNKFTRSVPKSIPASFFNPKKKKRRPKNRFMFINGIIRTGQGVDIKELNFSIRDINRNGSLGRSSSIFLIFENEKRATFKISRDGNRIDAINPSRIHVERIKGVRLTLVMSDGTLIKQHDVFFDSFSKETKVNVEWNLETSEQIFELASSDRPTLAGYGISLNSVSPNPDESLLWE